MLLELRDICFYKDGKKILDKINLKLEMNKFVAVTGPNGSGKSTLMKIIMGIEKQTSGVILFNGKDISDLSVDERAKLGISYAFQQPIKFKGLTVFDLLSIASKDSLSEEEASAFLEIVGLEASEYLNRELDDTLSGGEHKRIEIASVLLRKDLLTIFDEPEAGIDLWSFNELVDLFKNFKDNDESVVIISHQEKILEVAEVVILLKNGKIDKVGTYDEVIVNG